MKTLVAVAGASAAAGALVTTAFFSTRKERLDAPMTIAPPSAFWPTSSPPPPPPLPSSTTTTQPSPALPPLPSPHAVPLTPAPVDPSGLFKYGFPGPIADLRPAPSLVSSFDRRTRNPHWVAEHITASSLASGTADRRHSVFVEDASIPAAFRAKLRDYQRSGYDRGHQVPAADAKWSQPAMDATFALSNMCPQVGEGFNRDYWAHLEDFCRRLTRSYSSVRIVTGPLYLPRREADGRWRVHYEVIGSPPNVAVPTHFFKVVYGEGEGSGVALAAFVLPNEPIANERPLREFEVPVEVVERASGLEFAAKVPAQMRRRLCQEVDCSIVVKEYAQRQKDFGKAGKL